MLDAIQRGKVFAVFLGKADFRMGSRIRMFAANHQNRAAEQLIPHDFIESVTFIGVFQHNELSVLQTRSDRHITALENSAAIATQCLGGVERLTIKSQPQEVNGGGEYEMAQKGIAKQRLAGAPTRANKKTLRC